MKPELFNPYKEVILRCIHSSTNHMQLYVCFDLITRFIDKFSDTITPNEVNDAAQELYGAYTSKQEQIFII